MKVLVVIFVVAATFLIFAVVSVIAAYLTIAIVDRRERRNGGGR